MKEISHIRFRHPELVAQALMNRKPGSIPTNEKLMIIACDHPARGALGAGANPFAMANREELLERCMRALSRPGVNGFLGTADLIEDLTLLGALEGKLVFGSMNRTGLQNSAFEIDDRFGCYTPEMIVKSNLDGGKTLTRISFEDLNTPRVLEETARAVNQLSAQQKITMIEPFISDWRNGQLINNLTPEAVIKSITIAAALGACSAYTWLKLPCVQDKGE